MKKIGKKIEYGDLFMFLNNNHKKYGLIQVIQKSQLGYWVRVFYKLYDKDNEKSNLEAIVNSENFYYIKDFNSIYFEVVAEKFLGNFTLPGFVEIPRYMRFVEPKPSGKNFWHLVDMAKCYKKDWIVATFKKFDEQLRSLSPADPWAIEYIKNMWEYEFTLDKWDDEFLKKIYSEYQKENLSEKTILTQNPTKKWERELNSGIKHHNMTQDAINQINSILDEFISNIKDTENCKEIKKNIEQLVCAINTTQKKYKCIETEEREELLIFISESLKSINLEYLLNDLEYLREW